jgi:hypothetical protein
MSGQPVILVPIAENQLAQRVKRSKRSRSSSQLREAVDFESVPGPAFSHSDSMSRIDRPRTNTLITIARSGRAAFGCASFI